MSGSKTLLVALVLAPLALAQDFTVQFAAPLSAANSHKGDTVRMTVVMPAAYQGDAVVGQITDTKASKGQSILQFTLTNLVHQGVSVPIACTISSISNALGQPGVDDQSRPFAASILASAPPSAGKQIGRQLGGMLGGSPVAVPDNSNGAPPPPNIRIVSQAAGIELGVGASMGLTIHSTGQQSLESLRPNPPVSKPAMAAAPAAAPTSGGAAPPMAAAPPAAAPPAAAGGSAAPSVQPELKSTKIEFVAGEKAIFFDDFSDMDADEPPPHWKVRDGKVELKIGGDVRELATGDSGNAVHLTAPKIFLPQNFTFELVWTGTGETDWIFRDADNNEAIHVMVRGEPDGKSADIAVEAKEPLGEGTIQTDTSKPVTFALWAQQGRVRAYLNGERLVDVNQVQFGTITQLEGAIGGYRPNGIRSVRIAESAPDFSSAIDSGKYITHGIHFDTDSDRLKPESAAVLKQVAAGLNKNPGLKLEIDGYTDSVGDAAHNKDLSRRRAEAVRSVLISQFGIDAGRLKSNGFGPDNPIGMNDSAGGRAENRRVEFVKM